MMLTMARERQWEPSICHLRKRILEFQQLSILRLCGIKQGNDLPDIQWQLGMLNLAYNEG